jgi:hypothetical protein
MSARGSSYGMAALSSEVARVEQTAPGFRHMNLFSAACHVGELVAGREIDEATAESFLIDVGRSIDLLELDVRRQVARGLEKGKANPRTAPKAGTMLRDRTDAVLAVVEWWGAVQAHEWKGRTAGTTLRILAAFAVLGTKAGKLRLEESYREVAEAAGVSVGTVAKHKARWLPFVHQVRVGNRITASRTVWQLVVRANGNRPASPAGKASGLFPNARTLSDPAHNAWHGRPNDWRVYCLLTEEDTSTAHLVEVTGLHPSTIRRIGARLVDLGAVERGEDGWYLIPADAEELQHVGEDHAERLHQRHVAERKKHRTWLDLIITARQEARAPGTDKIGLVSSKPTPDRIPRADDLRAAA